MLPACTTQTTTTRTGQIDPSVVNADRSAMGAPKDLHDISAFLLRFAAEQHRFPESLAQLREVGIMPPAGYPGLSNYAYASDGLGRLSDGQIIMVVDTAVRVEDHLWCVLQEPGQKPRAAALNVRLVPLADLRNAARTAR